MWIDSCSQTFSFCQVTTAIAFFATAICPVPALKLFALFSGLLIVFDYILCLLLVLPSLCIFDRWLCCDALWWCGRPIRPPPGKEALIRRVLRVYYSLIHRFRCFWIVSIIVTTIGCSFVATKLSLPDTSEVRVLRPEHEFEQNYRWRQRLLVSELERARGTRVWMMWGITPADTGNHRNPRESSTIVLDESFDPSSIESQVYLRDFCDDLLAQEFASPDMVGMVCPMNLFDNWLREQSLSVAPKSQYLLHCNNATGIPLSPELLHPCMIGFAQAEDYKRILFANGKVRIIRLPFRQKGVLWDVGHEKLGASWNQLNEFTRTRNELSAPPGVDKLYGSSHDFWYVVRLQTYSCIVTYPFFLSGGMIRMIQSYQLQWVQSPLLSVLHSQLFFSQRVRSQLRCSLFLVLDLSCSPQQQYWFPWVGLWACKSAHMRITA